MPTFAMRGNKSAKVHGSYSSSGLEIKGRFHMAGPQPVGEDGAPVWVYEMFKQHPEITQIAINKGASGVVFAPIKD